MEDKASMSYSHFYRNEDGLIMITADLDLETKASLVFDTGATHTTIDKNAVAFLDFKFSQRIDSVLIETGNGIVLTDRYKLSDFKALGIERKEYIIQVYDFLSHGVLSDYDGILGLDFLEGYHFCIDTLTNEITIHD